MPTQEAIAKMVGLSRETVSHILKGSLKKKYNEATRRRVFEVAASLNYRPNHAAQTMRAGKSGLIGMIKGVGFMEAAVERSFGVANAIYDLGYRPQVSDLMGREGIRTACDTMIDERVEGLVYDGPVSDFHRTQLKRIQAAGIPIVTVSGDRIPGVPHVALDLRQSTRELVFHLIERGYRRLAMLMPEQKLSSEGYQDCGFSERISVFQEAVAEAGLPEAEIVHPPIVREGEGTYKPGELAAAQLLDRKTVLPDALLCANDNWALGALRACTKRNISVPGDIALTGFDNTQMGQHAPVSFTTVAQPSIAMAKKAVEVLNVLIRGEIPMGNEEIFKLPGQLFVRESSEAVPRK